MRRNLKKWLACDKSNSIDFPTTAWCGHNIITSRPKPMVVTIERILPLDPHKNEGSGSPFIRGEGISMSGKIIEFRRHHDLERARLCAKQAVPRSPAGQARLGQQIARISGLLGQLEDLTRGTTDLPSTILVQARASIEKTSRILQPCARTAVNTGPKENGEDDPQPDVDHRLLERMYRALDLQACATISPPSCLATGARSAALYRRTGWKRAGEASARMSSQEAASAARIVRAQRQMRRTRVGHGMKQFPYCVLIRRRCDKPTPRSHAR